MEKKLNAQEITHSLQKKGGSNVPSWRKDRIYLASKICAHCGSEFKPWIKKHQDGSVKSAMPEPVWLKQKYCSLKCAKRSSPTVLDAQARKKISQTLKEIKHKPIKRGGNGQLLPLPQLALLHALGEGWVAEHPIPTKMGHRNGIYPNAYKVDIANPKIKLAIELDGGSHGTLERKAQDQKKVECLVRLGWRVLRISNEEALHLYSTFKSVVTLLTLLKV